jgi:hypothetical protein
MAIPVPARKPIYGFMIEVANKSVGCERRAAHLDFGSDHGYDLVRLRKNKSANYTQTDPAKSLQFACRFAGEEVQPILL